MDKISVIIPVYKVEKYLDACVESVVGQSYNDLEIILVDDGSPDTCPSKCDGWAERDGRIRVIHQENRGLSGARNSALDIMSGKYVTFVDSDDLIHPEMLERLHGAIIDDGSDIAVCSFERFTDGEEAIGGLDNGERTVVECKKVLSDGTLMNRPEAWGKLYRAEIFSSLRFKEGILYEDTHIHPYVLNTARKLSILGEKMYRYRQLPTSIMSATVNERKFCVFDIYSEHIGFYRALNMPIAAEYSYQALTVRVVKASVICGKDLRRRFYKAYFKNLPTVVFAPPKYLGIKNRLLYLSAALPLKVFRDYYKKRLGASVNFSDTNNF